MLGGDGDVAVSGSFAVVAALMKIDMDDRRMNVPDFFHGPLIFPSLVLAHAHSFSAVDRNSFDRMISVA